jgi:hypothetical protein
MATASLNLPLAWTPGALTWAVIGAALVAGAVAIVMLLRTRLSGAKPWQKCAILSLWVHVLLAFLAAWVRVGAGGPGFGPGEGGPMRVTVMNVDAALLAAARPEPIAASNLDLPPEAAEFSRDAPAERVAPVDAIALAAESPTDPEPPASPNNEAPPAEPEAAVEKPADQVVEESPVSAPAPPKADLTLEAPTLLSPPEPEPETDPEPALAAEPDPADDVADDDEETDVAAPADQPELAVDASPEISVADAAPSLIASAEPASNADATSTYPVSAPTAASSPYAARFADREAMVNGGGGNPTTERAVRAALAWLAAAQEPDGRWDPKRHGAGQERYAVLGQHRGTTGARADTGITALALLAFMGSGHTHLDGPYAETVARGLDYLRRTQGPNGNLGGGAEFFAHMYCHSMATFAVGEAAAMTGDEKLMATLRRAVAYTLAAQNATDGGWRYQPGDAGDTSQLGWQLMSLKSATLAGVEIPSVTLSRVDHFLRSVERGASGGLAAYRPEGPPSRAMTAEALFCRQLLTRRANGGLSPAAVDEARRALLEEPPGGVMVNLYYWYYATIALHRMQHHSPASDEAWDRWNDALTRTLVGTQNDDGSWPSTCIWGGYGGRVYTTSLAAMCLEVYYRYTPENDAEAVARRHEWQSLPAK